MTVRKQMKVDLLQAMKAGRKADVTTLRTLIAAIDNAEAVPVDDASMVPLNGYRADVPRRQLTLEEINQILHREAEEHRAAAAEYQRLGRQDQVEMLHAAIALIAQYRV